jgi:hypothetical protein
MHKLHFSLYVTLYLLFFTSLLQVWGQSFTHRKHNYQWDEHVPVPVEIHPDFASSHAVVLHEETRISLINQTFRQYIRIRFLDDEGIRLFNRFSFPHPVDPIFWYYQHPYLLHDSLYAPKQLNEDFLFVTARIIRNGEFINANLLEQVEPQKKWVQGARLDYFAYHLMSRALQPGDELELVYAHKLPAVSRFLVNRALPVQSSVTILMFPLDRIYYDGCTNLSAIRDSSIEKISGKKFLRIRYEIKNIQPISIGCTDARSSEISLIQFYPVTDIWEETLFQAKYNTNPYRWKEFLVKEVTYDEFNSWKYYSRQMDENNITFNEIFKRYARDDLSAIQKMNTIQAGLMQDFDFKNDYAFFSGYDQELERISHYLQHNIIRQRSVHRLYRELMNRLDTVYYLAKITDKRVGGWTYPLYGPLLKTVTAYALMQGKSPVFYLPKDHRYGYFPNELPFYLQGVRLPLIPQKISKTDFFQNRFDYPLVTTPKYQSVDNLRTTKVEADVNLDLKKVTFNADILLQGNFSTSTRSLYLCNYKDSTLNRSYLQKITCLNGVDIPFQRKEQQIQPEYPFTAGFKISWELKGGIHALSDSMYVLKLSGLINLLQLCDENSLLLHGLNYQYDFAYRDAFDVELKLNRNVRLLNGSEYLFLMDNEYFIIRSRLYQSQPNLLKVEVLREQKTEVVPQAYKDKVIELERIIRKLLALQVIVKVISN